MLREDRTADVVQLARLPGLDLKKAARLKDTFVALPYTHGG